MNDIDNPLASHPLLQKRLDIDGDEICGPLLQRDIEAKPVIAEAMADAMAKPLISVDFGAVEVRAVAARDAGLLDNDDAGVPWGVNRARDGFQDRTALKAAVVGAPDVTPAQLAAQVEAAKPVQFVVPHNISEADLKEVIERIQKETKLPFEVVRAAVPEVAKAAPAILRSHQEWMREERTRQEARLAGQILEAVAIIKKAARPVKLGFIMHELGSAGFRALEPELDRHPNVKRKTHKNQIYYTWKE